MFTKIAFTRISIADTNILVISLMYPRIIRRANLF